MALDPGPNPGWAKFNNRGELLDLGIVRGLDNFPDFLEGIPTVALLTVVYEEYRVLPHKLKAHAGRGQKARIPTVESIGHIRSWCLRHKIPMVIQPPTILAATSKHTQVKMPSDHDSSHHIAAYLHGARYLIDEGIMKTALEMEVEARNKTSERISQASQAT